MAFQAGGFFGRPLFRPFGWIFLLFAGDCGIIAEEGIGLKKTICRAAAALLAAVFVGCAVYADIYQQAEGFGQMEKLAQVAVLCRVEEAPQRQEYVMHTSLQAEQVFKGKAEEELLLRQSIEEEPLSPGRYILFLEEREDNQGIYYYLCCGRQGVFALEDGQMIAQDPAMDDAEMQSWAKVYLPQEPPATAGQRAAWLAGLLAPVLIVLTLLYVRGRRDQSPLAK